MFLSRTLSHADIARITERWLDAMRRLSVVSVVGTHSGLSHDGKKLSGKAAARLAQVKNAKTPADFSALYQKKNLSGTGGDQGGLDKDRKEQAAIELSQRQATRSDAEFASAEKNWKAKAKPTWTARLKGLDLRKEVTIAVSTHPKRKLEDGSEIDDPDLYKCSWCDTYGPEGTMTFGKGPLMDTKITEITMVDGLEVITHRWVKSSRSMVACSAHCLNLADHRVTYDKHGEPVYAGVKTTFPASKG